MLYKTMIFRHFHMLKVHHVTFVLLLYRRKTHLWNMMLHNLAILTRKGTIVKTIYQQELLNTEYQKY